MLDLPMVTNRHPSQLCTVLIYSNFSKYRGLPSGAAVAVLAESLQTRVRSQAVLQPSRGGFWPAGLSLSHCALVTPVAGRRNTRQHSRQVYSVSSDTLGWLAGGLSTQCVKEQCGLAGLRFGGRTALDLRLSRVRMGVTSMVQDCNYQLGRKGVKKNKG